MSTPHDCASCGSGLAPGARFCRNCGAAAERTEVAREVDRVPSEGELRSCPACGAPIVSGARFCHSCGESAVGPEPVSTSRTRGPVLALAAFGVCLLVGGMIAGGAYLLSRDDSDEEAVAGPHVTPIGGTTQQGGEDTRIGSTDTGTDEPEGSSAGLSPLIPGRYIQAGSFRSPEGAGSEVDRLLAEGIDVKAVPADFATELLPGFQVLLVGPLASDGAERRALRELEDAGVAGFGRDLTPSEALSGPAMAAGSWSGSLEQSYLRGDRPPKTYRVDLSLSADGEGGTVDYPEQGCRGSLALQEDDGYSFAYAESIESGGCGAGGVWHLRPEGSEITAVRLYDDLDVQIMVDGKATAVGG